MDRIASDKQNIGDEAVDLQCVATDGSTNSTNSVLDSYISSFHPEEKTTLEIFFQANETTKDKCKVPVFLLLSTQVEQDSQ